MTTVTTTEAGLLPATTMGRRRSILRLAPVLRRHPWGFALTVTSAAGNQGFGVAAAGVAVWLTGRAATGSTAADLTVGLVVLGCCVVGKAACAWAEMWVAHDLAYRIMIDVRGEVFDGLERLAPGWLLGKRTGDLAAAALTDVEALEWFYAHTIAQFAVTVLTPIAAIGVIAGIDLRLAATLLPFAALIITVPFWLIRLGDRQGIVQRTQLGALHAEAVDGVHGLRELVLFGQAQGFQRRGRALQRTQLANGSRMGVENGVTDVAGLSGEVRFEQVSFRYGPELPDVLHGVDFVVAPGETLALVGSSGAGKSTCANLLLRFWDVTGERVRLGGVDIRDLTQAALRQRVALVPQDGHLFNPSIAENIRLGRPEASTADIADAARRALVDEFADQLPDRLDTVVSERGAALSGRQRQRIALARALLRDAAVLVLDEAVSSVDAEGEVVLRRAMDQARTGRTTIVIAHRLSTIRTADRVVVLESGWVVEQGRHHELAAVDGPYRRLLASQVEPAPLDEDRQP